MASPASIARHPIPSHARRLSDRALGLLVRGRPRPCRGRGAVLDRPGFLHDLGGLIGVSPRRFPGLIDVLSLHGARATDRDDAPGLESRRGGSTSGSVRHALRRRRSRSSSRPSASSSSSSPVGSAARWSTSTRLRSAPSGRSPSPRKRGPSSGVPEASVSSRSFRSRSIRRRSGSSMTAVTATRSARKSASAPSISRNRLEDPGVPWSPTRFRVPSEATRSRGKCVQSLHRCDGLVTPGFADPAACFLRFGAPKGEEETVSS